MYISINLANHNAKEKRGCMARNHRILVAGSANVDFVAQTPRIPERGETLSSGGTYAFYPGGKSANSAVAAARLGADVVFCARVGADLHGDNLIDLYKKENIDTRYISVDKWHNTGLATVIVEDGGHNRIITFPGANSVLSPEDVEDALTCYPDALLLQLEVEPATVISAVSQANALGVPVFLDAGPSDRGLDLSRLGRLEVFSPNETEAYDYTGIRPSGIDSYIRICIDLYSRLDVKYIVLKLGEKGAYLYDGKVGEGFPAYYVRAVDTTAAGDAFTAALTYEYLRSGDIRSACRFANAVGGYTVTREGAIPSLPTAKEVSDFIKSFE